jgi:catechol-2,3-dioxygenase
MNINFIKLDHIQICIEPGKEDEARKFYGTVLGLIEIPKPERLLANGGLWYSVAGIQLHIGTDTITAKSKAHPAFEISGLAQVRTYLESCQIEIQNEIQIDGQERFTFHDPFGNRIELLERTFSDNPTH